MGADDQTLYAVECSFLVALVGAWVLSWLVARLRAGRPGLALTAPLVTAAALRVGLALLLSAVPRLASVRGPDEHHFTVQARKLSHESVFGSAWPHAIAGSLHEVVMAIQRVALGQVADFPFRLTQITIAIAGISLLATATYDLGGPRAATVVAWILAFEPTNVLFSGLLHKESLVMLGEGLVALGA